MKHEAIWGNLTSDGARTYAWDAENRLVGIAYPGQGAKTTAFSYDGLGRRIQIISTPTHGGAVATDYLWCGERLCQARNSSNAVIRSYYAEGEFTPGPPAASLYYAPDQIGSVRRVFSASGAPTYDYDAYGRALQTTPAVTDFGYAGMIANADSGLYLTTRRPYDPVTGRFLTRDPIGEAGDPEGNLYVYVGGDPVNESDPWGLVTYSVGGSITFIPGAGFTIGGGFYYTTNSGYGGPDLGLVYNTFPWPSLTEVDKMRLEILAQAILDARVAHPGSTLADLYDPDAMPPNLRAAHRANDLAVDRLYRKAPFESDRERVEHLFTLYEKMTAGFLALDKRGGRAKKSSRAASPR